MVSKAKAFLGLACFTFGSSIAAGLLTPVRGPNGESVAVSQTVVWWTVFAVAVVTAAGFIPLLKDVAAKRRKLLEQIQTEMEMCATAYLSDLQDSRRVSPPGRIFRPLGDPSDVSVPG
jgi:hypothetical protein